ncbi:pyruvate phosphate dikinase (plasmid) [Thioalkalivibrio sp. K90mix]|uniref:hypothetical protein n=1 Tax=Thioalkalivibrio sp. (strain K90mix) TaxID=396595 RepID=UPI000195A71B|nr:hypothetical protein [Thioalkalivibrio sp. K90mix]ADC73282.1 pyruvate phosphate dikinase [Thioalkalivibrio sp. K90mix]
MYQVTITRDGELDVKVVEDTTTAAEAWDKASEYLMQRYRAASSRCRAVCKGLSSNGVGIIQDVETHRVLETVKIRLNPETRLTAPRLA